ncbi:U3 small nucleolar RNA-associated protein [Coccidioides posadasii str. Silveira]|uniref:Small nucleolar ribonucleoprotein complex subunit n=1 Tax=Coccidioides posadasii (strain RMSCC 757 / Silveira) TaxID=443226 RepID=E9DC99_COCPS|nr:small nucleolar ribonucleoprotein complex subunit [Coccidioides posadasii str. Silveira]QVM09706.1 U3 small nucleolar RNA-associated protein [Coccidioides posadasii str. Silveira]
MDIHRCRFVPYNPQAINALAFSHPPSTELQGRGVPTLRLAIGRANGDIELWNPSKGTWFQETILRGGKDRSIEGLAWTVDPGEKDSEGNDLPGKLRLFSIGYSSVVTEWDLEKGRPARHSSGNYGEIWCLAAQPRWESRNKKKDGKQLPPAEGEYMGQHLAVGCADGAIVILSTADGDLKYLRTMRPSTKKSRVLNITFQNRNTIVAAYADSSIRIFDIRSGKLLRTVTLGKGPNKAVKELLVWSVKCLPDGTIVSGDSAGEVRFWDSKNYSLIQRIQSHQADVLDIAVSADGESVVSAGADQRTAVYRLKAPEKGAKTRRWVEVMHRRYHTHDVKALAVYETKDISVFVSGGLDTVPVVVPLRSIGKELHRKLPSLPQSPPLSSSPSSRLLMGWWDREVNIWRVSQPSKSLESQQHRLVAKVLFQGEENLTSAALSSDGKLLVAASVSQIKAFCLSPREDGDKPGLQVNKLEIPFEISKWGAKEIAISPDSKWLCFVRSDNVICMARIDIDPEIPGRPQILPGISKLRRAQRNVQRGKLHHGSLGAYDRTIRCIAFSSDSNIVACGDLAGFVDAWVLEDKSNLLTNGQIPEKAADSKLSDDDSSDEEAGSTNTYGQRWIVPRFDSPIPRLKSGVLLMTFRPSYESQSKHLTNGVTSNSSPSHNLSIGDDRLVVLTTEHHISEFNVLEGKLTGWSRRNPKSYLPKDFTIVKDRAMGALWDKKGTSERLWLYGPSWLWMFDLAQDFPAPAEPDNEEKAVAAINNDSTTEPSPSKKRKRGETKESKTRQPNSGAGDRVPYWQDNIGLGRKMRKVIGDDGETAQWIPIDLKKPADPAQMGDEAADHYEEPSKSILAEFRREPQGDGSGSQEENGEWQQQQQLDEGTSAIRPQSSSNLPNEASEANDHDVEGTTADLQVQEVPGSESKAESRTKHRRSRNPRRWWHTFKYREILGIVPLGQGFTAGDAAGASWANEGMGGLEVAVVERPMWDVALPGRYVRDYE